MQGAGAGKVASGEPTKIQIFKFKFKSFLVSQVVSLILHSRKSRNHFPPKCDFWRRTERLLMTINPDRIVLSILTSGGYGQLRNRIQMKCTFSCRHPTVSGVNLALNGIFACFPASILYEFPCGLLCTMVLQE